MTTGRPYPFSLHLLHTYDTAVLSATPGDLPQFPVFVISVHDSLPLFLYDIKILYSRFDSFLLFFCNHLRLRHSHMTTYYRSTLLYLVMHTFLPRHSPQSPWSSDSPSSSHCLLGVRDLVFPPLVQSLETAAAVKVVIAVCVMTHAQTWLPAVMLRTTALPCLT
jgi:hypothetical protein